MGRIHAIVAENRSKHFQIENFFPKKGVPFLADRATKPPLRVMDLEQSRKF